MKTAFSFLAFASLLVASGCTNETDSGTPTVTYPISYMVETSGGTIAVTQVQYTDTDGSTVVELNPALPWSVNAVRGGGQTAQLVVTGSTGGSSTITARIQDDPAEVTTPVTHAEASCVENTNPCTIDVSNTF